MNSTKRLLVLLGITVLLVPLSRQLTGQATGTEGTGCGGEPPSEEDTASEEELRRLATRNCAAGMYYYNGAPIEFNKSAGANQTTTGVCAASGYDEDANPISIRGKCVNGHFKTDSIDSCGAIEPVDVSCADFEPISGRLHDQIVVTKLSPYEYFIETKLGQIKIDFQQPRAFNPRPVPNSKLKLPINLGRLDVYRRVAIYDKSNSRLLVPSLSRSLLRGDPRLTELAFERAACLTGIAQASKSPDAKNALSSNRSGGDSVHFTDKCLWEAPASKECAGQYNIKNYAEPGRYHPLYLSDWSKLTPGFQAEGFSTDFDNPGSANWNEYEINYGPYGRVSGNQLVDYDSSFNPSKYLAAHSSNGQNDSTLQSELENFTRRLDEDERASKLRRSFQGSRIRTSESVEDLQRNLLVTSDLGRCNSTLPNTDIACLPSPLRIYYGARNPWEVAEDAYVFRIEGYENVTIEDIDMEVLPHPDIAWTVPQADEACGGTCSNVQKKQLLEYFLPTHRYVDRWNQSKQSFQTGESSSTHKINAIIFDKIKSLIWNGDNKKYYCTADDTLSASTTTVSTEKFIQACYPNDEEAAYARIWDVWAGAFDMERRIHRAGEIFYIFDNHSLVVRNVRIRALQKESVFHLSANRYQQFDNVLIEGVPATRIIDLNANNNDVPNGLQVDDEEIGFEHFYREDLSHRIPVEDAVYLGGGISNGNGGNVAPLPPGGNCCIEQDGTPVPNCDPADSSTHGVVDHTAHGFRGNCEARALASGVNPVTCDNRWTTITNVTIQNCTSQIFYTMDERGMYYNSDGIASLSASGLIFNSHFENFRYNRKNYCDTMVDLSQRSPCYREPEALDRALRVERNRFVKGPIKNEGTSEPETLNLFANNEFLNINLQDYHRKWPVYYYFNTWLTNALSLGSSNPNLKLYLWKQATIAPHKFHAPKYGTMHFRGNLVRSNYTYTTLQHSGDTPFSENKMSFQNNAFLGPIAKYFDHGANTTIPEKSNDFRCHHYADPLLYNYDAPQSSYQFLEDSNSPCVTKRWTQVTNPIGAVRHFGQKSDSCNAGSNTFRCVFDDFTSVADKDSSFVHDFNTTSMLNNINPYFDNFGPVLRSSVGDYLKANRFFTVTSFLNAKRRVPKDFNGRYRGFFTNAGSRHGGAYSFFPAAKVLGPNPR